MAAEKSGAPDPMHQFDIVELVDIELFGLNLSFTNSSLFMVFSVALIIFLTLFSFNGRATIPTRLQSIAELSYEFVAKMVRDNVGDEGQKYFPFIFCLFMFVLFCNMLGMIPYTFTVTSHIIVTFALAIVIFFGVTLIGFIMHGIKFFNFFVPSGVPKALLPLLVVIEVISYLTRPVSLSVRLFANMMAGHTMLKVFGFFVAGMFFSGNLFISPLGIAPLAFIVAFTGLEILVAFLQAYVFAILTCIYLNDSIHMH
ncbi:MAG: F0F1 ATP synthase subunit A [Rhodobiaceae bacterium]|nr:F0F1 ATP synthase subunit A [Rhodobiaceae bacterium]RPF97203.1 MAG: F0F1 ATP synthase subunit A [Rhizobiales bacterium TMED227]